MSTPRQKESENIARAVVYAFRISVAVAIALAASLFVVMVQTETIPIGLFLPTLCSFMATLVLRSVIRILRITIPKYVGTITSIGFFILAALVIWLDTSNMAMKPPQPPQYLTLFFCIWIGYWLADYIIESDASSRPFAQLRAACVSLLGSIGNRISIGEAIAFGVAVLVSLAINVPTPRPQVQSVLTGSAVVVMASLFWLASFASAAQPANSESQQP